MKNRKYVRIGCLQINSPMNILFLMKVFEVGGQEVVTLTLAESFVTHGHNVDIVCFNKPNQIMVDRVDARIRIHTLCGFKNSAENVEMLRSILIEHNVDIVINQWGLPYVPAKVLDKAKDGLKVKTIAIYHNSPETNARIKEVEIALDKTHNPLKRILLHCKQDLFKFVTSKSMCYVYRHSDLYMVLSSSFVEKFKKFTGIRNPKHLAVQTNPVTINASDYTYSQETKQKEIIYMGRIDYNQKRVIRVVDTWAILEPRFHDWRLIIVGNGPERTNLERHVQELGLKNVYFDGFQKPRPYYERASVLVLTSEYEGFPLVLAECMSFGVVPVVYGSYSAVYDIIKNGENGIIVLPKNGQFDATEMAKALASIMADGSEREKMAKNSIATSRHDYSVESIYHSWEKIMASLMV